MVLGEAEVELDIPAVDIAQFVERFDERCERVAAGRVGRGRRLRRQNRDPRQLAGTLCAGTRADAGQAKPADEEDPPFHSMTSSARARI